LTANPHVALTVDTTNFPPDVLLARGVASIEFTDEIPDESIEASRRIVGEDKMGEWETGVWATIPSMALIIIPTWVKVNDFITQFLGPDWSAR